jgi:RNA polymerase sigma factor (TIGR02999 family)
MPVIENLIVNTPGADVTQLLLAWNGGDQSALDNLMPLVYEELRRLARNHLRFEHRAQTLQPTAVVNDAYMRLIDQKRVNWQNRAHFFGAAAQIIRRLLVDHARARGRLKRGGNLVSVTLNEELIAAPASRDVLALDDALSRLAKLDAQQARVVELRFFAGLSIEETAEAMRVSAATIKRDWATARAWLYRELTQR